MYWRAYWWGTEIVADTKEDEILLKSLAEKLDKKPLETYDDGELETSYGPDTLTFNR